ncbi:MAG: hypothetical protein WAO82_04500 [Limnohabitans sp.]
MARTTNAHRSKANTNASQQEAIQTTEGTGSGKTFTLVERSV